MRDIIFRGKWKDTGEWFEGYHVCIGETYHYICTGKLDISGVVPTFEHYLVYPETVGQYTGLIDKNGVKIFEGDILSRDCYDASGRIVKIVWAVELAQFCAQTPSGYGFSMLPPSGEVIGNIHDTPELLEAKE